MSHQRLEDMLLRELSRMRQRRLKYAPADEDIPATVAVMADDLRRRGLGDDDGQRIADALNDVGCRTKVWPTVMDVVESLRPNHPMAKLTQEDSAIRRQQYTNGIRSLRTVLGKVEPKRPAE